MSSGSLVVSLGRNRYGGAAVTSLLIASMTLVVAPSAFATAGCSSVSPSLSAADSCTVAGSDSIAVPAGAGVIHLAVTGAGGGGSRAHSRGGDGGAGATLTGDVFLPAGTASVRVVVGAGGVAGSAFPGSDVGGGGGGGGSAVFAYDSSSALITALAIAGAGGGGGGCDICNYNGPGHAYIGPTAKGGDAGSNGADGGYPGYFVGPGGAAANGAVGGAAGGSGLATSSPNSTFGGSPGASAAPGVVAAGGVGGLAGGNSGSRARGGNGGGGYAGGGGAGGYQIALDAQYSGGAGGGGSNFTDATYFPFAVSALAISGPGAGGIAGGPGNCGYPSCNSTAGNDGLVTLTFDVLPSPTLTSVSPVSGGTSGGGTLVVTGTNLIGTSAVTVGGAACVSFAVQSPTQLTCVLPAGAIGTADVSVTVPGGSTSLPAAYTYVAGPVITSVSPASGSVDGGGTLTITGTGFTGATAVLVGGAACSSYVVVSATQVTCVVPPAEAGTANVAVTVPVGSAVLPSSYLYAVAPTITSVAPGLGSTAGGSTVLITGANLAGTSSVTVGGTVCTSFTVVSATQISCVVPAGVVGLADVTVTGPGGSATLTAAYAYAAAPSAPVSLSVSPGTSSLAMSFGVPATDGGSPITGYQVSVDGGTTWAALTSTTAGSHVTATVAGLHAGTAYPVRVRAVNVIGAGPASAAVNSTIGSAVPAAPAAPAAVAGVASATVTWPVSTSAGVTGYVVSAHPGPSTCTTASAAANSCLMGLTAGTRYTFTVVARGAGGDSADSAVSNEVIPTGPVVPVTAPTDAPTTLTTTDGVLLKVEPAQPVTVVGTGFAPYSTAKVIIYSSPVLLATVTTDGRGDFRAPVTVPSDLEVGGHNFVASGIDPQGRTRQLRMPVTITAAAFAVRAPLRVHVVAGERSLTVSFNRAVAPAGTRIRGYQVSVDGGRTWVTVHPAGRARLHVTVTGLRAGVTYPVRVRAVTSFGPHRSTSLVSRTVPGKPFGPWFHDPISLTGRREEAAVPVNAAGYHGAAGFTAADYRSYDGSIAVPAGWTRGHHLIAGQAATLTGDGLFDFDSAVITRAGLAQLQILAASLKGDHAVTCEGYTDYAGVPAHELDLSARRAQAICSTLVRMGANVATHTVGYGGARPVTIGGTPQSRAANRRVVVLVNS